MPSATPLVTERTNDGRLRRTREGYEALRVFDVVAASDVDALLTLARERGIGYGTLLRNAQGERAGGPLCRVTDLAVGIRAPSPIGGTGLYEIRARYTTREITANGGQPIPEPGGPPVYRWGRSEQTKSLEVDLDGEAIENSRGEPIEKQVVVPARTLNVQWYQSTYNMQDLLQYDGAVNSDVWTVAGRWKFLEGQALCHGIDPFEEAEELVLLSADFEFQPGGALWHPFAYVDAAFARKGELIRIGTEDVPAEGGEKIFLDGLGNPLNVGAVAVGEHMDPKLIERRAYPLVDFRNLPI